MSETTKRELILVAAEELFRHKGFEATTVRELAEKAGVNLAMINYYFGSKEKLLEELIQQRAEYTRLRLHDIQQDERLTPIEKMDRVVEFYVEKVFSNRGFHHMMYRELSMSQRSALHSSISDVLFRNVETLRGMIRQGIDQGHFRPVDVELTLCTLYGTINQASNENFMGHLTNTLIADEEAMLKQRLIQHLQNVLRKYLL
ncbi:DNA-binding transcriptional regulator, AcrR family [Catalinimonas alkaloidigena]|uniref:DNA-binding transcriptional regulator, AcrR family n=1 Tax=Catalinimonas alkaloidigena TaxID=1075417 RepID=A0A1G8ZVP8_9BACT|nr:TetR family transcriptional regulator [Catalinimonas alkaloidigena]SDK19186.1 DNA-binding transcriptional regulator, AcrR family [Catalinimonas alkaloidigena]